MPRRPAPITLDEVRRAFLRAEQGKGIQLACLIKRCSRDDLAAAFGRVGPDLQLALAMVGGRQEGRADIAAARLEARRQVDEEAGR